MELQRKIWRFFESAEAGEARPREADKPGEVDSGEFFFLRRRSFGLWMFFFGGRRWFGENLT